MLIALAVIVGLLLLVYGGAPLVIHSTLKLRGRPTVKLIGVQQMPPAVYEHFGRTAGGMQACGFELMHYLLVPDMVPHAAAYVALWKNRVRGQMATAVVVFSGSPPQTPVRTTWYVEFLTKLTDAGNSSNHGGRAEGLAILTNNGAERGSFKKTKAKDTLRASWVQDPQQLYAIHLHREAHLAPPNATRYIPANGDDLDSFLDGTRFEFERQVRLGLFWHDVAIDSYRPTVAGAYRMTWSQLPPIKQMLDSADRRRAESIVARLQSQPPPPLPPSVPITHESPYKSPLPAVAAL